MLELALRRTLQFRHATSDPIKESLRPTVLVHRADTSKMNILFINIKDCNAGVLGCYGNPICKTPNLDRFAATAVRFDSAYCQAICCNPTRTSFLEQDQLFRRKSGIDRRFLLLVILAASVLSAPTGMNITGVAVGRLSAAETACDIVISGGTSGGVAAALQARRMGKSVVLIEPTRRLGGLTTGGLGQTDIGNKSAIGGIAREFYQAIRTCLRKHLITNYLPGQCCYNLGEYPCRTPWKPDAWDEQELDRLRDRGIRLIQVHEEWNDSQRLFGSHTGVWMPVRFVSSVSRGKSHNIRSFSQGDSVCPARLRDEGSWRNRW